MNCPSCGVELPGSAKFCGSCGYQMTAGAVASMAPPGPASPASQVPALSTTALPSYDQIALRGLDLPTVDLLKQAWEVAKDNLGLMIGGSFVCGLLYGLASNIPFGGLIVGGPLLAGSSIAALRLISGQALELGNFFDGFKKFMPLMLLSIVSGFAMAFGFLLLILPGLYLAVAFSWAQWIVLDRDEEFWPALMASMKVVNSSFGSMFAFIFLLGLVNMAGVLACGLGALVTWPVTILASALAYQRNFGLAGGVERLGS